MKPEIVVSNHTPSEKEILVKKILASLIRCNPFNMVDIRLIESLPCGTSRTSFTKVSDCGVIRDGKFRLTHPRTHQRLEIPVESIQLTSDNEIYVKLT